MSYWHYSPEDDKQILYLRDELAWPFSQIALHLDWPHHRVYSRYRTLKAVAVSGVQLKYEIGTLGTLPTSPEA